MSLLLLTLILTNPAQAVPLETKTGVVFVAGGAGSIMNLPGTLQWALKQKSSELEVREFTWSHGAGRIIRDIQDIRHLVASANQLATDVNTYLATHPGQPVYLLGRSTGAMIVLLAAEQLPAGTIERIILLSPAVSPEYDLVPALRATRREIVSFRSSLDVPVLHWGTSLVGTADRYYSKSAGLHGFTMPASDHPSYADYQRLRQIAWSPSKILYGHLGGHLGNGTPLFLLFEVVPFLVDQH